MRAPDILIWLAEALVLPLRAERPRAVRLGMPSQLLVGQLLDRASLATAAVMGQAPRRRPRPVRPPRRLPRRILREARLRRQRRRGCCRRRRRR